MNAPVGIVWNPTKGDESELRSALEAATTDRDARPEFIWSATTADDPGRAATENVLDRGCELVIAAGGDGTVRAVAERLAGTGVDLGIVPRGTGNLLARNLDVPIGDVESACRRALESNAKPVDIGWVETDDGHRRAFVVMIGFGLDARMLAETDDDLKDRVGWLAYVEAMGRALASSDVLEIELALDDSPARTLSAHTLLIGNCGTMPGGVTLLPDARPDDGILDLLVIGADDVGSWVETVKTMAWDNGLKRFISAGETTSTDAAEHGRARTVRARLPKPQMFEIDGEEIGEVRELTATVETGALSIR